MTVVIELDDAEFAVVTRALGAFRGPRVAWAADPERDSPVVQLWRAEAATAGRVLAKLDARTGRKLAGPFEPIEGVEWCTVHASVCCEDEGDESACDAWWRASTVSGTSAVAPCNLVTLYIEVQA